MKGVVMLLLSLAAAMSPSRVSARCGCRGWCLAFGDPHISSFDGKASIVGGENLVLYSDNKFSVTASTFGVKFMNLIQFGSKSFLSSSCKGEGPLGHAVHHFDNGDYIKINVTCSYPLKKYKEWRDVLHLNLALEKFDAGAGTSFIDMERRMGATGLCMDSSASSRRLGTTSNVTAALSLWSSREVGIPSPSSDYDMIRTHHHPKSECTCSALCSLTADPILKSFYGKRERLTQTKTVTVYGVSGFNCEADVEDKRVRKVRFGHEKEFVASRDCNSNDTEFKETQSFHNKDYLDMVLRCQKKYPSHGWYFDIHLAKADRQMAGMDSFRAIETKENSTGLCDY